MRNFKFIFNALFLAARKTEREAGGRVNVSKSKLIWKGRLERPLEIW
jgi:hypothetical protein